MKVTKTVTEPVTRERIIAIKCDKCGADIMEPDSFDTRNFSLEFTRGKSYPEGGHSTGWRVEDLCDDCAPDLRALLDQNGYTVSDLDIDW